MKRTAISTLQDITGVILAGGFGTRLRAAVSDRPKVLAPVNGRPFLAYLLDILAEAGLGHVVLCTGYLGEQVQAAFGERYQGMTLFHAQESSPLGTGGALRESLTHLQDGLALVLNGDSFCEVDLIALASWHRTRKAHATVVLREIADPGRYGRVVVTDDGQICRFDEKSSEPGPAWINAGIYLIDSQLLQTIPGSGQVSLEREVFPHWIGKGLFGYRTAGRFVDIGTPESYAEAEQVFGGLARQ